jgi:hypothetical protein
VVRGEVVDLQVVLLLVVLVWEGMEVWPVVTVEEAADVIMGLKITEKTVL